MHNILFGMLDKPWSLPSCNGSIENEANDESRINTMTTVAHVKHWHIGSKCVWQCVNDELLILTIHIQPLPLTPTFNPSLVHFWSCLVIPGQKRQETSIISSRFFCEQLGTKSFFSLSEKHELKEVVSTISALQSPFFLKLSLLHLFLRFLHSQFLCRCL